MYVEMVSPSWVPGVILADGPGGCWIPLLFTSLTNVDQEGKPAPGLAKTWETSQDGKLWTFHLRTDFPWVRYNPDTGEVERTRQVIAHDVEYSVKRTVQHYVSSDAQISSSYWTYYNIKGAKDIIGGNLPPDQLGILAEDDLTLKVELEQPDENFPLQGRQFFAVPEEYIKQYGDKWMESGNILTNGPYVSQGVAQRSGEKSKQTLVKNRLYPDAVENHIERIEVICGIQPEDAMQLYKDDKLDILPVRGEDLPGIQQDPERNKQLYYGPRQKAVVLLFNTSKAPFDRPHVMEAFQYAINRDDILENVRGEGSINVPACSGIAFMGSYYEWGWAKTISTKSNPKVARFALELSGIDLQEADAAPILMQVPEDSLAIEDTVSLLTDWKDTLGIEVETEAYPSQVHVMQTIDPRSVDAPNIILIALENTAVLDATSAGKVPFYLLGWSDAAWFPLYITYPDAYLVGHAGEPKLMNDDAFARELLGFTPAAEISCPPVTLPSANELADQCMDTITQAQEALDIHACDVEVPLTEEALLRATMALSIDSNNSNAYYCRGRAYGLREEIVKASIDLHQALQIGLPEEKRAEAERILNEILARMAEPACSISTIQFNKGWDSAGNPLSPSNTCTEIIDRINVYWRLNGLCNHRLTVKWFHNDTLSCYHYYEPGEHTRLEGSMYTSGDGGTLVDQWMVKVLDGAKILGEKSCNIH